MADRSDVVIAVWDGQDERGTGGTAEIVRYVRDNQRPLVWLPTDGSRRVIEKLGDETGAHWMVGLSDEDVDRLCEYNDARIAQATFDSAVGKHIVDLDPSTAGVSESEFRPFLDWALPAFTRADLLATHRQRWNIRIETALYVLAAIAVTFLAHEVAFGDDHRWVWVEVGALAFMLAGWWLGRHLRVHETWISSRYLAERLRAPSS